MNQRMQPAAYEQNFATSTGAYILDTVTQGRVGFYITNQGDLAGSADGVIVIQLSNRNLAGWDAVKAADYATGNYCFTLVFGATAFIECEVNTRISVASDSGTPFFFATEMVSASNE